MPVLLGGAALTRDYAVNDLANLYKGKLFYCKDAFAGPEHDGRHRGRRAGGRVSTKQQVEGARRKNCAKPKRMLRPMCPHCPPRATCENRQPGAAAAVLGPARSAEHPARSGLCLHQSQRAVPRPMGFQEKGFKRRSVRKMLDEKARPIFAELQKRASRKSCWSPRSSTATSRCNPMATI